MLEQHDIREAVRKRYTEAAESGAGCCGGAGGCGGDAVSGASLAADGSAADGGAFAAASYAADELRMVPAEAARASLGCGNPTAVAELLPGETVLDLGSGGGLDVLLAASRVGAGGFVYGLDMTDAMLALARRNAAEAGATNVAFLRGTIEAVPLPDASVDVIVSNCVINLSVDKPAVFAEMQRVLRPGGRVGLSDVVADDALSPAERAERGEWVGCIAGALSFGEYRAGLEAAGFQEVSLTPTHPVADGMHSVLVKARRP